MCMYHYCCCTSSSVQWVTICQLFVVLVAGESFHKCIFKYFCSFFDFLFLFCFSFFCFVFSYISGSHIQVVSKSHKDHSYSSVYKIHTFLIHCVCVYICLSFSVISFVHLNCHQMILFECLCFDKDKIQIVFIAILIYVLCAQIFRVQGLFVIERAFSISTRIQSTLNSSIIKPFCNYSQRVL